VRGSHSANPTVTRVFDVKRKKVTKNKPESSPFDDIQALQSATSPSWLTLIKQPLIS
jgi:hypothetical protein